VSCISLERAFAIILAAYSICSNTPSSCCAGIQYSIAAGLLCATATFLLDALFTLQSYLHCVSHTQGLHKAIQLQQYALLGSGGPLFLPLTALALVAGACITQYCAGLITATGLANGPSVVICAGIATGERAGSKQRGTSTSGPAAFKGSTVLGSSNSDAVRWIAFVQC
jgi:preprotein translocase subunit SecY